jgi:hypothetical protein
MIDIHASLISDFYDTDSVTPTTRAVTSIYLQRLLCSILNSFKIAKSKARQEEKVKIGEMISVADLYLRMVRSKTGHPRDLSKNFTNSLLYAEVQGMHITTVKVNLYRLYHKERKLSKGDRKLVNCSLLIPDVEDLLCKSVDELNEFYHSLEGDDILT